jgi:hypothetical protein
MKQTFLFIVGLVLAIMYIGMSVVPHRPARADVVMSRQIIFPVIGAVTYYDDFGTERAGGIRAHKGNDLMGKKMMPLVSAVDGVVTDVDYPEAAWGYSVTIKDAEGYKYVYIHMNNDTPGTDDGKGDGAHAYALDIQEGNPVVKGQLIGYMGDSGNAETTQAHLHFEMYPPNSNEVMSPYLSLKAATKLTSPVTDYPKLPNEMLPYENFSGGANVTVGNFDKDKELEVAVGARAGGGPLVKVLEQDGTVLYSFFAYSETFRGGVDVASGDVDGDGVDEIITAPGPGGGPHVRVFKANGAEVSSFFAYTPGFLGGVHVSSVDVDGDKKSEIVTGPMSKGGPHIRVLSPTGEVKKEFFAYDANFQGGVDVAGLFNEDGDPYIATAPGPGGGAHIKVLSAEGVTEQEWFAYDASFLGGVRLSGGQLREGDDSGAIFTVPWTGGGPHLKAWNIDGTLNKDAFASFEPWWRGGYDISASNGKIFIVSGPGRRTSVREFNFANPRFRDGDFEKQD